MKLSIIVPVYNVEGYLRRCLDSCLQQDIPSNEYEIVIVNDGSTDGSLSIANEYAIDYHNIRIISQVNGGLSRARNVGLEMASGDYVWFVDSDDSIAPNCLGTLLDKCRKDCLDILALGWSREGKKSISMRRFSGAQTTCVLPGKEVMRNGWMTSVCAPFHLFRRSLLLDNSLNFLPGCFHEDEAFTPVAFYLSGRVGFSDQICYYVYVREGSIMTTPTPKRAHDLLFIARNLDDYAKTLPLLDQPLFSARIARILNQVLKLAQYYPSDARARLEKELFENRDLFVHMRRSKKFSFAIIGILLIFFPRHPLSSYSVLFRVGSLLGFVAPPRWRT